MSTTILHERVICRRCRTSRRPAEGEQVWWMGARPWVFTGTRTPYDSRREDVAWVRCQCGKALEGQKVAGRYSATVRCGARCQSAIGPACECQCGGENHGV